MLTFDTVLVATDFSPASRAALKSGQAAVARGGTLYLLHVVEPLPVRYELFVRGLADIDLEQLRTAKRRRRLARLVRSVEGRNVTVKSLLRTGRPWEEAVSAARASGAELVCVGHSGVSPFVRLLLGSTAGNVVRRSPVPVLVTRRRPLSGVRRVLVPVDFDDGSDRALRFLAARLPRGVQVRALFVVPSPLSSDPHVLGNLADERAIARDLRAFLTRCGLPGASYQVRIFSEPAGEILRVARRIGADLIVISTHGRTGLARALLGSVAEKVVMHADRPVLVLPGPAARGRPSA